MSQVLLRFAIMTCLVVWALGHSSRAEPPKANEPPAKVLQSFHGEITSIEKIAKAITVRKFPVSKTFLIAVTCKITTQDKPEAALEDLKVGDKVKILYEQEKDGLIARRITLRGIDAEDREEARQKERLEHR